MIGNRIRTFRVLKGLKTKAFSKILGISQGALSGIENNKSKPSADTLAAIVQHTDIDPKWLLIGEGDPIKSDSGQAIVIEQSNEGTKNNISELSHTDIIKQFKNIDLAREVNRALLAIEHYVPQKYLDLCNFIKGAESMLPYNGPDRRIADDPDSIPGGKERRGEKRRTGT